jgi:hypothetical protein
MKTLSGLAKEIGDRAHSSAAVRIAVGFMVICVLESFKDCGLGLLDQIEQMVFHGAIPC